MKKTDTLINRLEQIVSDVHINEVKKIVDTLVNIGKFRFEIENELSKEKIYEKVLLELERQFGIINIKIIKIEDNNESIILQNGTISKSTYSYTSKITPDITITILIEDNHLNSFEQLSLNTYFNEIIYLIYTHFILDDIKTNALLDPLTGLTNRIGLNVELKLLVPLALREKMNIGVCLINIDRFTAVNDEYGDEFGDEFLKLYANTIKNSIRTSDIAVRFSGGAFLVLFVNVKDEEKTIELANKLKTTLTNTYLTTPYGDKFQKTVCVGVSMFPQDSSNINETIKYAEIALNIARDDSRDNLVRYTHEQPSSIELF